MELVLAGGAGSFISGGAAAGTSMSWNPIGWVILAVVAVVVVAALVYTYWDEICDFFSSIGNAIADTAKVVWEYVTTAPPIVLPPPAAEDVLPSPVLPPLTVPIEGTKPIDIPTTITKPRTRTRNRDKDIWKVYDLHVGLPGLFRDYTRGLGFKNISLLSKAIWKYGITSMPSVYIRYLVISQKFNDDKEIYILDMLSKAKLLPKEWYLYNVSLATANAEEVRLIDAYVLSKGKFPPGNTFRG